jgi:hypothetical protein
VADIPEPTARPTRYEVTCLPEGDDAAFHMTITVEYRGRGLWAVLRHGEALGASGEWDYEPLPSSRDDDWVATHRFDLDTALRLAREAAPHLTVNGYTVADLLGRAKGRNRG